MDGFANVIYWHDWWRLWTLKHCLAGYGFSHTLALYCRKPPVTGKTIWWQKYYRTRQYRPQRAVA